ncbi:MAG TPA: hypothetical protein VH092_05990 [Urbifossiella sp.]|nr:hypothetical protein [Urbifossiella sp.]
MTDDEPTTGRRGVPGKYVVLGLGAFGVIFFGFVVLLALKLDPVADRFHNPTRAASTKK